MAKQQSKKEATEKRDYTWLWVALVILALAAFWFWRYQAAKVFSYVDGDDRAVLVLLRGSKEVYYEAQYTGRNPVVLNQIEFKQVVGSDMDPHVDVEKIWVISNGQEIMLDEEGFLEKGLELSQDQNFEIHIVLLGSSLGSSRLESFWLYVDGQIEPYEMPLSEAVFSVE